jgi:enoyl-CoA hydratase
MPKDPETIRVERRGAVGLITLDRPKAYNALNDTLMDELTQVLTAFDADEGIGAMVITGSDSVFAAGADIKFMADWTYMDVVSRNFITRNWEAATRCRKPVIAAVAGLALGGGCELAMMCDFILAADNAKFGQPEVLIGTIPGAGGTQRLTRLIGKSKAMEMILSGRNMLADEAERCGLVSRVVPVASLVDEAVATAQKIAGLSRPVVSMAKDCVNRSYETTLAEGVRYERGMAYATFGVADHAEGLRAFIEKRKPVFQHR